MRILRILQRGWESVAAVDRKPNPVRLHAALRRRLGVTTIPLGPALLAGSSDLPGGFGRAVLFSHPAACAARRWAPPYLVLLRAGFCLPSSLAADAVRSYRTFSPLPKASPVDPSTSPSAVCFLCHCPSGCPDRALPGALPSGVRTFLPLPSRAFRRVPARRRSSGPLRRRFDLSRAPSIRRFPAGCRTARASCRGCCAACRSLPRSWRCSRRARAASRRGTRARTTP